MPTPDTDVVVQARELLAHNLPSDVASIKHALFADAIERQTESPFWSRSKVIAESYARAPELIAALADEVERLRNLADEFAFNEGDDAEGRVQAMRVFHGKD